MMFSKSSNTTKNAFYSLAIAGVVGAGSFGALSPAAQAATTNSSLPTVYALNSSDGSELSDATFNVSQTLNGATTDLGTFGTSDDYSSKVTPATTTATDCSTSPQILTFKQVSAPANYKNTDGTVSVCRVSDGWLLNTITNSNSGNMAFDDEGNLLYMNDDAAETTPTSPAPTTSTTTSSSPSATTSTTSSAPSTTEPVPTSTSSSPTSTTSTSNVPTTPVSTTTAPDPTTSTTTSTTSTAPSTSTTSTTTSADPTTSAPSTTSSSSTTDPASSTASPTSDNSTPATSPVSTTSTSTSSTSSPASSSTSTSPAASSTSTTASPTSSTSSTTSSSTSTNSAPSTSTSTSSAPTVNPNAPQVYDLADETMQNTTLISTLTDLDKVTAKGATFKTLLFKQSDGSYAPTLTVPQGTFKSDSKLNSVYTPTKDYVGNVVVGYRLVDSLGNYSDATLSITVDPAKATTKPSNGATITPSSSATSTSHSGTNTGTTTTTSTNMGTKVSTPTKTNDATHSGTSNVVGPTVQTDYVSENSSNKALITSASIATVAGMLTFFGASSIKRRKTNN